MGDGGWGWGGVDPIQPKFFEGMTGIGSDLWIFGSWDRGKLMPHVIFAKSVEKEPKKCKLTPRTSWHLFPPELLLRVVLFCRVNKDHSKNTVTLCDFEGTCPIPSFPNLPLSNRDLFLLSYSFFVFSSRGQATAFSFRISSWLVWRDKLKALALGAPELCPLKNSAWKIILSWNGPFLGTC